MSSKAQRRVSDYRRKQMRFHANQYTRKVSDTLDVDSISASAKKLCKENYLDKEFLSYASSKDYEVNTRIAYSMRAVGLGFCGIKNFPPPVSQKSYERILRKINLASREVADKSMKNAAKEEVSASRSNKICVCGDGCENWRIPKSGHSYEEWKLKHQPHCVKIHIGSSSEMEVDGMKEIFQRSVPQRNAKYIKYIGDGDTKTFPELQSTAPYSFEKVECVGHIQKRMGARLRKLKTMNRGKKLSDGKSISGKNRLTDKFIDIITTYYGNAIRQNNSFVSDMRQAIWAIYCHYRSTDEEPMHHFCPIGDTSWCKYEKAVATNSASLFKHKNIVPIAVMDEIKPIIAELSAPKLLKKCVKGKTQNANESFNSTVWKYCPKTSVWVISKYCRHSSKGGYSDV
ncbi:uncharacterized protein TNCV_1917431 [Trichonephila clavipes]|uniref:Mutator-like transposase domain-containing protein n=1 Tax=Trichonephila clavipes TaxID=2585209 RepID=A0A8X6W0P8_TRICX|nr:uncharacterized protein TNCV_1917431 [Trichonephila clavipes]